MDLEENEVESSSDAGPSGLEEPSESGMGVESSEAMSADSSDAAAPHGQIPDSDCHVGQSSEGVLLFVPETSSSTDVRVSSVHLPDSSSVAQSTSVSSVSTVTQSVLVSESAQMLVHSSVVSDGAMMVSDSTASTSSDLGSAIDKIIESTIGPDIMNGCIAVTSAEDGGAETTQYLILQGPDDGAPMVAQMSSALSSRSATEASGEGPTSTCVDQGDLHGHLEPSYRAGYSGYAEESGDQRPDQPEHSHPSQYMDCGPDQTGESSSSAYGECSGDEPDQTRSGSGFADYSGGDRDLPGYVECSGADSNPTSHGHYVVECSEEYLECGGEAEVERPRGYIDSSADHGAQTGRQYPGEYRGDCVAAADSEQPGYSHCTVGSHVSDDEDDEEEDEEEDDNDNDFGGFDVETHDLDRPQHSHQQQQQQQQQQQHPLNCYVENSGEVYADEGSSSSSSNHHHPMADTAGSGGLPEALESSESQPGPFISSSGTYNANPDPEPEPEPEPELGPTLDPSGEEPQGSQGSQGPEVTPGRLGDSDMSVEMAEGSGDRQPNLAELEEMMEVVIVQQFKCKMCPYKSTSKDTLINHMRDKHFRSAGGAQKKRGRGRPPKSETLARRKAEQEAAEERRAARHKADEPPPPPPAEEEDDEVVDAGAIDDPAEDSDYNPADEENSCKPQPTTVKPPHLPPPISSSPSSSSSQGRPRRKVGRPRKFSLVEEGYGSREGIEEEGSPAKKLKLEMEAADPDEASTSGLGNAPTENGSPDAAEPSVSQSDSENKDPSSHAGQEEDFPKKRGRPSKRFLRKKYRRYMNRNRYYKSLKPLLRPHNCWICGSRFLSQEDLRFHVDSHEGNEPELFKCLQCNYHCKRWSSLKEHMFNHEGKKPFKCEECDYSSVYNKDVLRHSAVHNKEKKRKMEMLPKISQFPCPICHRVYPMQKRLTQHMKTHSTEKPHMCDKCGKSFKKRYTFKMHLLTHIQSLGDSQLSCGRFKCEYCDYTCDNKKMLLNHQLSHTNDKPFKCDYCQYSTTKEEFLVSHLAIKHTGEKPFSCGLCHFTTKHRKNLRLHVQCRHPEAFEVWSATHPEEPARRRRQPFFTLQQIEELKQQQQEEAPPGLQSTIVALDPSTLQPIQGLGKASVSQDAHGNTTIIYESAGPSDLSAQNALDLLLNMSNARELVGNSLQVAVMKSDTKAADGSTQKVVTFHVSESGDTVMQEAFEEAGAMETTELAQIAMEAYEAGGDFSVVEQAVEQINSPDPGYSNDEGSPSAGIDVSESESMKSEKYYLTSTLADGVLQQVELSSEAPQSPTAGGSPGQNTKRFSCRICMEAFHGRSDMENHKRAHLDPSTFKCPDCNFTAPSWLEVRDHMNLHAYLRPHKCPSCSFASKNKKDLRRHMMTHTNEKPFACKLCGQRFNRNGHLKFHMERLHNQENAVRKSRAQTPQQQTIIVHNDEEALATLQSALQSGQVLTQESLQALGQEHVIMTQEQSLSDQEEGSYIQQITTMDGQTVQQLMSGDNQVTEVQYIISEDGVQHLLPQEYVVLGDGNHIQMADGQIIQYEHDGSFLQEQIAVSHDGQIQYLPISSKQQIVIPEELEAAAHSAVTVADAAAMVESQTVYTTEATAEQLEQLQQQGIHYDVITITEAQP
ncbi:zinc finger protein 335 isoform X3 [Gadus macrocephalus]|uniref:zinc finger protein 335 isoform X3 n=1 Tax=Gadus macrocephalus TaxID=80720 RepID=UPI0028CB813C|nr:zinc finger protein 335 isoform X3 [Gadus macrocephalus]